MLFLFSTHNHSPPGCKELLHLQQFNFPVAVYLLLVHASRLPGEPFRLQVDISRFSGEPFLQLVLHNWLLIHSYW
jgi:hypothetical protein